MVEAANLKSGMGTLIRSTNYFGFYVVICVLHNLYTRRWSGANGWRTVQDAELAVGSSSARHWDEVRPKVPDEILRMSHEFRHTTECVSKNRHYRSHRYLTSSTISHF
jgi:hypothetical protein